MEQPKRKNLRLQNYDYSSANYYFVTICTAGKKCIFGKPGKLNALGQIAERNLLEISEHFPNGEIDCYVIMPNHIHLILIIQENGPDLSTVIGSYKSSVSKKVHKIFPALKIWQTSFYDHIIRNEQSCNEIRKYIADNPRRWNEDKYYCE